MMTGANTSKPALCPVCGNIFTVPTTHLLGTQTLGKKCPHCRTMFNAQTIKVLHEAAAVKGPPEHSKIVMAFGMYGYEIERGWHQARFIAKSIGAPLLWRAYPSDVVLRDVTRWTELPVYSIEIEK